MPDRLRLRGGVLVMDDGSDVGEYLKRRQLEAGYADGEPVVVLPRRVAQRLASEASSWRLHKSRDDERFSLCA